MNPKTLFLDLDETLIHSWESPSFIEKYGIYTDPEVYRKFHPIGDYPLAYSISLEDTNLWGLYRPHLFEFLKFAEGYFESVVIWSAGIPEYVHQVTKQMFAETNLKSPHLVWSRHHCAVHRDTYYKPLTVSDFPVKINLESTFFIDDKNTTFRENPKNGIVIPAWSPGTSLNSLLDRSENSLLKLITWFELPEVKESKDVRQLDKSQIFQK